MKVKVVDFEEATMVFLHKVVATMPESGHKFLAGVALGSSTPKIESMLSSLADADGCIDTDMVRKAIREGVESAGERITFTIGDPRLSMILKPVKVTISPQDLEEAISSVERMYR